MKTKLTNSKNSVPLCELSTSVFKKMRIALLTLAFSVLAFNITYAQIQIGQDLYGEMTYDLSGRSVSMPNVNTVAIGAIDLYGISAGYVHIYTLSGNSWQQKGSNIDGEAAGDQSGLSVSMPDVNTVAIGAIKNNGNGSLAGHVRIYIWNNSTWVQKGSDIDGEVAGDNSGSSVSMPDANTVAIGATKNDGSGTDAGHVRIYTWNGSAWQQKGSDIDGEAAGDNSGWFVCMSDTNTVAIGALYNDGNGTDAGHVRIYEWNSSSWQQKGIDIDGEAAGDQYGVSVSMPDANTVAIGATKNDGSGTDAGHVRIYTWNGSTWQQKGNDIDGEAAGDNSGWYISMPDANSVAIGAYGNDENGNNAGQVRIYAWNNSAWLQKGNDIDGDAGGDYLGISVSMPDANTFAIGAYLNNGNGIDVGQVRVYRLKGVYGSVYNDVNENCIQESEVGLAYRKAIVYPGNIVVETNNRGHWLIDSLPIGNYSVGYDISGKWQATCANSQGFTVTDPSGFTQAPDFGLVSTQPCASPEISINMPLVRRCFNQKAYVNACNHYIATGALNSAYADVELDSLIIPQSASLAYTSLGNNTYRFQLGTLNPGQCVNFTIDCNVSCDAILGQTLCMEANLFPADSCVFDTIPEPYPGDFTPCTLPWDKSSLQVEGYCQNDSIYFVITNTGEFGNGDMDCFSPVRIYIDGTYTTLDSIKLVGGESIVFAFAGDGRTWRLEADQHPLHPGNSHPNATVEACGNLANWTPDLVNVLPPNDADPIVDIYCGVVTGSYDPNDKTGYPTGLAYNHYIMPNQQLQYVIRFQNTGTDTAFTVVVRDTLDMDLDIFSVVQGVASHAYNFQMYGPRVLEWTFYNIQLPDSNHSEAESHGFCTFTVNQNHDLANNTKITNSADIYFDYNAPITTNQTLHTVNAQVQVSVVTKVVAQGNKVSEIMIYPNPATNEVNIEIPNFKPQTPALSVVEVSNFKLFSIDGKKLLEGKLETPKTRISTKDLESGVYFIEVNVEGEKVNGKLVITK